MNITFCDTSHIAEFFMVWQETFDFNMYLCVQLCAAGMWYTLNAFV